MYFLIIFSILERKIPPLILGATKGIHEKFTCQSAKCPNATKNINMEQIDEFFTFNKNLAIKEESNIELQDAV